MLAQLYVSIAHVRRVHVDVRSTDGCPRDYEAELGLG